jgi:hypothetical protein
MTTFFASSTAFMRSIVQKYKDLSVSNTSMHTKTWYGIDKPWDKYIAQRFGKYTLVNYYDCHSSSVDHPQHYRFILLDNHTNKPVDVVCKNILGLEDWCKTQD